MSFKSIPYFEVFAFTRRMHAGNPAGVCLLEEWLPDEQLQAIATENNLAETAFVVARGDYFDLRWMTPTVEVDLCGHATLAAAHVLFHHRDYPKGVIRFQTKSGELRVERDGKKLVLDFPSLPAEEVSAPNELTEVLGARPEQLLKGRDYIAIFSSQKRWLGSSRTCAESWS